MCDIDLYRTQDFRFIDSYVSHIFWRRYFPISHSSRYKNWNSVETIRGAVTHQTAYLNIESYKFYEKLIFAYRFYYWYFDCERKFIRLNLI